MVESFLYQQVDKCKCVTLFRGFPGGAVVKNLPARAGDTGLSPGPGRSYGATKPVRHDY